MAIYEEIALSSLQNDFIKNLANDGFPDKNNRKELVFLKMYNDIRKENRTIFLQHFLHSFDHYFAPEHAPHDWYLKSVFRSSRDENRNILDDYDVNDIKFALQDDDQPFPPAFQNYINDYLNNRANINNVNDANNHQQGEPPNDPPANVM